MIGSRRLTLGKKEPLLFKFKKEVMGPSRLSFIENEEYDETLDMVLAVQDGVKQIAIDGKCRIGTKKADLERSEDQKDSNMWG